MVQVDASIARPSRPGSEQLWIAQRGGLFLIIEQPAIGVVGHIFDTDNLQPERAAAKRGSVATLRSAPRRMAATGAGVAIEVTKGIDGLGGVSPMTRTRAAASGR